MFKIPNERIPNLPTFSGNAMEWPSFSQAVLETTEKYNITPAANLIRLRTCLQGQARKSVAALLECSDPAVIMQTLEQHYCKPNLIMLRVIVDLNTLPTLNDYSTPSELYDFAVEFQRIVRVMLSIEPWVDFRNSILARPLINKLSPQLMARWFDYTSEVYEYCRSDLIVMSKFVMRIAERTSMREQVQENFRSRNIEIAFPNSNE